MSNDETSMRAPRRYVVGFIGAGPNTLYCLERILTRLRSGSLGIPATRLSLAIYDKSGHFGPGVHSIDQPSTNHLNRTAEQVSLCADASHRKLNIEVAERQLVTLYQWAMAKWESSRDPRYHISNQHWVDRALLGEALADTFAKYVSELRQMLVTVTLVPGEVTDVRRHGHRYRILCPESGPDSPDIVDFVFLCTGHTANAKEAGSFAAQLDELSRRTSFQYCHCVYPIQAITNQIVPPGSTVACQGMGLASIDCINWLTSGRGGYFVNSERPHKLRYIPSGFEPAKIYPLSESGVFAHARAFNEKENVEARRHVGIVFKDALFDSLRAGRRSTGADGPPVSLEDDIVPLLAIEMMMLYYRTLFSAAAVSPIEDGIIEQVQKRVWDSGPLSFWEVYEAAHSQYALFTQYINTLLLDQSITPQIGNDARSAIVQFVTVRLGSSNADALRDAGGDAFLALARRLNEMPSPWLHENSPLQHLFHWRQVLDPLSRLHSDADHMHGAVASWLERDILGAAQGNMSNPLKAALDGAIRDLRPCFRTQVEWGATGPEGTRQLYSNWYRVTNRLAVGTSLAIMKKILALAEAGVVDFSYSRNASKFIENDRLYLSVGNSRSSVDALLNATVHRFNLRLSDSRLYQSLRAQGLVRQWEVSDGMHAYSPGAVEVGSASRLVVSRSGETIPNMVALGAPVDGPFYYRLALSRPYVADSILFDADQAVNSMAQHHASIF